MIRDLSVVFAAIATLLSCRSAAIAPARDSSPVRTDETTYSLHRLRGEYQATAIATYVNRTGASVYYARCGDRSPDPLFGVRRTGGDSARRLFSDHMRLCVGGVPTGELRPGDSVSVQVPLGAHDQPTMSPPMRPEDIVGLMRVELELCARYSRDSDSCQLLPLALRQSNAFQVRY